MMIHREDFRAGLDNATPEVAKVLRKVYRDADYAISKKKESIHSQDVFSKNAIILGSNASPGTIAHELFHEIDVSNGNISLQLSQAITQDMVDLNVSRNGDIKSYLQEMYQNALSQNKYGEYLFNDPYRGVSDILSGMSGGKVWNRYGQNEDYWKKPRNLEAEAWTQFGRTYYNNDPDVKKV